MNKIEITYTVNDDGSYSISSVFDKRDTLLNTFIVMEQSINALHKKVAEAYGKEFNGLKGALLNKKLNKMLNTTTIGELYNHQDSSSL